MRGPMGNGHRPDGDYSHACSFTDIMHIDQARQGSMLIDLSVMAWKKDQRLGRVDLWVMASLLGVQEAFVMTR